jgi:hypothetical protein
LACFSGSAKTWRSFEKEWKDVLKRHNAPESNNNVPYFHAKEAYHNQGGYNGWNAGKVSMLADDLIGVIGNHIYSEKHPKNDLIAYSQTIKRSDYNIIKGNKPLLRDINLICLDHCFGCIICHPLLQTENDRKRNKVVLKFDQNEVFFSIVTRLHQLKGEKRPYWSDMINNIQQVNMKENYGIQAADILAWASNRYFQKNLKSVGRRNFRMFGIEHKLILAISIKRHL